MKNTHKYIALLLALTLALSLSGCGSAADGAADNTTAEEEGLSHYEQEKDIKMETLSQEYGEDGPTIASGDGFVINMNKLEIADFWSNGSGYGGSLKCTITGKLTSEEKKEYDIVLCSASINGCEVGIQGKSELKLSTGYINGNTPTVSDTAALSVYTLGRKYMTKYTDVFLTFSVSDYKSIIGYVSGHYYPYGEEQAVSYVRAPEDGDETVLDNEYALATSVLCEFQEEGGSRSAHLSVSLYCVNKTSDRELTFTVKNVCLNGYAINVDSATVILPGESSYSVGVSLTPQNSMWKSRGIEKIEDVKSLTMDIAVADAADDTAQSLASAELSFTPSPAE